MSTRLLGRSLALVAAALGLAACGAGNAPSLADTPTANAPATTVSADAAAYAKCLADNGVDIAQLGRGAGGGTPNGGAPDGGSLPLGSRPAGSRPANAANGGSRPSRTGSDSTAPAVTIDPAVRDKALSACAALRPQSAAGAAAQNPQQFQAYLSCLHDNGVPVNTTVATAGTPPSSLGSGSSRPNGAGFGGPGGGPLGGVDRTSPAYEAANQKCQVLLPEGLNQGGAPGAAPATSR